MSPPPFQFVVGSRWPGWDDNWSFCLRFFRHALHEGFEYCGYTTRPSTARLRRTSIFRMRRERASFAHNHPLVLEEDARYRLDAWVRESEEKLRLRALEQLKKLKKGYDYQLVSAVTIPIHETFAMQTEILDNIGKILGHKAKEDCGRRRRRRASCAKWTQLRATRRIQRYEAHYALRLMSMLTRPGQRCQRVWSLRGGRCIAKLSAASPPARSPSATPPAPQGKAKKKDKKRAPPSPSPTPVAGPSDKRVKREVSKKREVLVLDESDEEDVKPEVRSSRQEQQANQQQPPAAPPADAPAQSDLVAFLTSLPPFPYEQYAHLFSRRTIRIDSSQQLLKFVTAVPPCFDTLSTELGKDEVKADGTIEEGMPMLWRMMLHSELLKRVQEEQ